MLLRAVAVCAILAVALAAPEIAGEDDEDHKSHKGIPAPAGGVLARGLDSVGM